MKHLPVVASCILWLVSCTFDTSGLSRQSGNNQNNAVCSNGIRDPGETCDGMDLAGQTCISVGFDGGQLACLPDCSGFDTSGCEGTGPVCGNSVLEGLEVCDRTNLDGKDCRSLGYEGGTLLCKLDCTGFDMSNCSGTGPVCGDGFVGGIEVCDSGNLDGKTCEILGYLGGQLACAADCKDFDTTGCISQVCGNGLVESPEVCDGENLNGKTCQTQGFAGGTLACQAGCIQFDTTGCLAQICGNGAIEQPEFCDGENLGGMTCQSFGCRSGELACASDCMGFVMRDCMHDHDEDGDGVDDNCDNCPSYPNPDQADSNGNGVGNVCQGPPGLQFVSSIHLFDPFLDSQSRWSSYPVGFAWSYGNDRITGDSYGTGTNYIHNTTLPADNYSVETTFHYPDDPYTNYSWAALLFAWQTGTAGALVSAYECTYERSMKQLGIYRYDYYAARWNGIAAVSVGTMVPDDQWHKLRAYVYNGNATCEYVDASGVRATVFHSPLSAVSFAGKGGIRLHNEKAVFTSYVIYY